MAYKGPCVVILGEAGSWVHGAQELTLSFGLLLRLFGIFPNNSNTASVGENSG